jgi:hypothetical protein
MDTLEPSKSPDFLDRFCSFHDAVVRRLEHHYEASGRRQTILTVSAQDQESGQGWSNVVLVIDGVSEIGFREGQSTRQVLSDGLILTWFNGHVWCDLSPYTSEPSSIDDVRRSDFYVVGEVLRWRSEPYSEE